MTKQFKSLLNAIAEWEKSEKNVCFIGGFVSFDKDGEVKDDRIIGYGSKETIKVNLEGLQEALKEDKSEFINW